VGQHAVHAEVQAHAASPTLRHAPIVPADGPRATAAATSIATAATAIAAANIAAAAAAAAAAAPILAKHLHPHELHKGEGAGGLRRLGGLKGDALANKGMMGRGVDV